MKSTIYESRFSDHHHDCDLDFCFDDCKTIHHKCKCDDCKKHEQKSCKERLAELITAATEIENSLANAINAEVSVLEKDIFTPEQLIQLTDKLEDLLKLVIKKEIVLQFLIEDATKACKLIDNHQQSPTA